MIELYIKHYGVKQKMYIERQINTITKILKLAMSTVRTVHWYKKKRKSRALQVTTLTFWILFSFHESNVMPKVERLQCMGRGLDAV